MTGGVPILRGKVRDMLVSQKYQAKNAVRDYSQSYDLSPEAKEAMARVAAIMATQKKTKKKD